MALELPDYVIVAFNLIGLPWPGIDEDELRAWSRGVRQFADDVCDNSSQVNQTMRGLADSSQSSVIDAVAGEWERHHQLITGFREPAYAFADALNVAADAVVAQKWVIIGAAAALAAEFTATQIGAIFTLGADEAAVPAEVISTRAIVKFALEELAGVILGKLINLAATEITDHLNRTISGMLTGTLQAGMEVQSLKLTPKAVTDVSKKLTGQASEVEKTGTRAHAENSSRNIEDNSGHGGWSEVISALRQMLLEVAGGLFKNLPATISKVLGDIAEFLLKFAERVKAADEEGDPAVTAGGARARAPKTGATPGRENAPADRSGTPAGHESQGNSAKCTGGDPVDLVSGQMVVSAVDLELPGMLPLVLRRAYASGYRDGRMFGPGWSGTLDQRIEVDADGIRFVGDDAQILHYPIPGQPGQRVLPVAGARWPLSWDRDTDIIRVEDPGLGWSWHFPAAPQSVTNGRETRDLAQITDRNGNAIDIRRDRDGLPVEVVHSGGYRVTVGCSRTAAGARVVGLRLLGDGDRQGTEIMRYGYDPVGRLTELTDFSGVPYTYEYDDADRITAWIDRVGYRYQYGYDQFGRVVRGVGDGGFLSADFDYDTESRVTVVTNSLGHAIAHHYDEHGHLTRVVAPDGSAVIPEFDRYGRMLSLTDELGRTTRFELDENGDPTRFIDANGDVTEIGYSDLRMVTSVTYGGRSRAEFTYDERGNLLAETDAVGAVTRYEYDDRGGMISATDALGNRTAIERDQAGLITAVTDALGRTSRVERDPFGQVAEFIDAHGSSTRITLRPDGRITEKILADGARQQWDFDAAGRMTELRDETGARRLFEYGPFGVMTARTEPDGARFEFTYDTELHLTAVTCGEMSWIYEYDPVGRLIGEQDFNGRRQRYTRDAAGQIQELIDADGRSMTFTYSSTGDLIARRGASGAVTTFDYDAAGSLRAAVNAQYTVEYTRDHAGRILAEAVNGRTMTYEYDILGRCTRRVTPSGIVSEWTYDATDHPLTLATTAGSLAFEYDDAGREITRYLGSGSTLTQTWDVRHRLTGQAVRPSAAAFGRVPASTAGYRNVSERAYSFTETGLINEVTDSAIGDRAITLTAAGRVAEVSGENWAERYTYDSFGNITRSETAFGAGGTEVEDRAYVGTRLRRAGRHHYEYDDCGRLARKRMRTLSGKLRQWTYTWDDDDQLIQVTTPDHGTWSYQYDPLGRRIAKQRLDEAGDPAERVERVEFIWDKTRVAEQAAVHSDGTRRTITWDWDPGTWRLATQTESSWPAEDDQGEPDRRFFAIVTGLINEPDQFITGDGEVIRVPAADIWGRPVAASARPSPLGKPGQYRDEETGLDYNYFRYYDSQTGRYLTSDPLGLEPDPNQYAYVSNPLAWIDPLGLKPRSQAGQAGGRWGLMQPANPPPAPMNSYEINHIPAQDSWRQLGLAHSLSEHAGPAIRMEYDDHRNFISTGSGLDSQEWRADQADLIKQGKFDEAMKMDIDEIRRVHGTKYDAAIKQMVDDMPKNRGFQKFLKKNGWKIRYCLLQ